LGEEREKNGGGVKLRPNETRRKIRRRFDQSIKLTSSSKFL
jgi:hypothetical protein